MEEIYLTGVYPGGEGAVVQVQRLENGNWEDFARSTRSSAARRSRPTCRPRRPA